MVVVVVVVAVVVAVVVVVCYLHSPAGWPPGARKGFNGKFLEK